MTQIKSVRAYNGIVSKHYLRVWATLESDPEREVLSELL
jgi:hypothetical protein